MDLTLDEVLQKAVEAHKAGQVQEADRLYTAILQAQPKHPDANHNMGVLAVNVNKMQEALAYFKAALESNPGIDQYWISYIDALIQLDQIVDAQTVLDQARGKGASGEAFEQLEQRLNEPNKVQKKATPPTDGQNPVRPNVLDSLKLDQAIRLAKKKAKAGSPEDAKLIYNDILGRFPKNKRALDGIKSLVVGLIGKASKVKEPPQDQQQRLINLFQQGQLQQALDSAKQLLLQFPDSLTVYNVQGAANAGLGQLDAAIGSYKQALKIKPDYADAYNNMGVALKNKGDLEAAIGSYNKALKIKPDYADAYNNMGLALQGNGDLEAAIDSYQQALKIKPDYVEAYYNMGLALQDKGDLEAAIVSYQQAIKIKPDYAEAHNTMGIALNDKGDLETAIDIYQKAIKIKPDYADAYNNMGLALMAKDDLDAGLANFKQALNIRPDYAEAYYNMGNALNEKGDLETAIDSYQKAIKIKPDYTEAYNNMGLALIDKGNLDAAIGNFKQALKIKPDFADAYNNMGVALREKGQLASSIDSLKQAIKIRPNFAEAFHNLSYPYFLQGSVEKGFNFYESRLRQTKSTAAPTRAHLIWDGKKSLSGKHFVIYEEQGLGDMIQFCRYLPLLEQKGADITFKVKSKLHALLQTMDSNIRLVTSFPKENKIDFEAPLMSLPHLLGTSLETIPAATPYLFADQEKIRTWGERVSTDRFKVGICWQGSTAKAAIGRSFPLSIFEGISSIPNIELISLHQGAGEAQMAGIDFDVTTLGHDFDTGQYAFLDTAAVMMNCDLIITCDTSIVHLASAIGRPTWLVLKQIPHWVWMLDRSDSPWYPTITLYRQKSQGDWVDVFETIERDLSSMLQQKKGSEMNSPKIPISWGELFDKITILQIKLENITSKNALENVEQELKKLQSILTHYCLKTMETTQLEGELRQINQQLWDIEDQIRDKERNNSFDDEFIQLARSVYITNDERSRIKRKINDMFGSELVEEKSYAKY